MKIEWLSPPEHGEWDAFVDSAAGGHIFLTAAWHAAWGVTPEIAVLRDNAGAIVAGVAFVRGPVLRRPGVRRPPYTPYNHPLIDEARLPRLSDRIEAMRLLLDALDPLKCVDFSFRWGVPEVTLPFMQEGFETRLGLSYVVPPGTVATWRETLAGNHRRSLKKMGDEIAEGRWRLGPGVPLEEAWPLFEATRTRKSFRLPAGPEPLAGVLESLRPSDAGEVWGLRDAEGRLRACGLLVRDRRYAYYLGAGLRSEGQKGFLGNYAVLGAMIEDSLQRGLGFDFEGSSLPGVEHFFRGFGGELRHVLRQVRFRPFALTLLWSAARSLERRTSRRRPPPRA